MSMHDHVGEVALKGPSGPRMMSVSEQLRARKENLTRELLEIEEAMAEMTKHPEVQNIIDRLSRLGYR